MTLETFEQIKAYIQKHIGEKITNDRLAKEFAYCHQSLREAFRQYEGISLHQYVLRTKMYKAKEYLEEGYYAADLPRMLGYRDADLFRKTYKKIIGESAKETETRLRKERRK